MKDEIIPALCIAIIIAVLLFLIDHLGYKKGIKQTQREAISAGVAHWTVNPTNGETGFEWKELK